MANEPTFLDKTSALADELKLEGDERNIFIDQVMTKAGWKRSPHYEPPEAQQDPKGNVLGGANWFGSKSG